MKLAKEKTAIDFVAVMYRVERTANGGFLLTGQFDKENYGLTPTSEGVAAFSNATDLMSFLAQGYGVEAVTNG